ncbi:hypothetical protein GDO81_000610 [Engystomops pustulosus]|uniref:Uncharacterized protein n=1 Tax=Engystomops pustulosus TaxID=76066 RepID=A0AAV7D5N4_ENGPU|nr:hypothetical protein GDO81_000610 [Engystomops pustulosus]
MYLLFAAPYLYENYKEFELQIFQIQFNLLKMLSVISDFHNENLKYSQSRGWMCARKRECFVLSLPAPWTLYNCWIRI